MSLYTSILSSLSEYSKTAGVLLVTIPDATEVRLRINLGNARRNGHIRGEWSPAGLNKHSIYSITDKGRKRLEKLLEPPQGQMELGI